MALDHSKKAHGVILKQNDIEIIDRETIQFLREQRMSENPEDAQSDQDEPAVAGPADVDEVPKKEVYGFVLDRRDFRTTRADKTCPYCFQQLSSGKQWITFQFDRLLEWLCLVSSFSGCLLLAVLGQQRAL